MRKASLIILFVLFVTACNPIPPEPRIEPSPPFVVVGEQPMQAGLYDFAFAFKQFDPGVTDIELEAYASLVLEISEACFGIPPTEGEDNPYTTGQAAAIQWFAIIALMNEVHPAEFRDPQSPNVYNSLKSLLRECRDPDSFSLDEQDAKEE